MSPTRRRDQYPGLQDITAHVELTGVAEAGLKTGAALLGYTSLARFLMNAGITDVLGELDPADPARFLPAANAVQKMLSETEMGELFKVIAFPRGIDEHARRLRARGSIAYALAACLCVADLRNV